MSLLSFDTSHEVLVEDDAFLAASLPNGRCVVDKVLEDLEHPADGLAVWRDVQAGFQHCPDLAGGETPPSWRFVGVVADVPCKEPRTLLVGRELGLGDGLG
ncbi:hypothetical protein ACFQI6_07150 [Halomicroarcula sp. GCM10025335]